jgi:membrane-associated phospholipid phosphatase
MIAYVLAGLLGISLLATPAAVQAQTSEPPTYVIDASYKPQLLSPPAPGTAAAQAEIDELFAFEKNRTDDQYWRVMYWDRGTALGPWLGIEMHAIAANSVNPVRASRALALVSAAINDAVVVSTRIRAETRRPGPCETLPALTVLDYWCPEFSYPSDHAVVAGAASTVLGHLFPMDAGRYEDLANEAANSRVWGGLAFRSDVEAGLTLGRQIGQLAIARGHNDGSDAAWHGTIPTGDGMWRPTPPMAVDGFAPPVEPLAGTWRPWNMESGSQFRPAPPLGPDSPEFMAEMREVYDVSRSLTSEQRQITKFWADGAGTATPAGHWNSIALDLVKKYMVYTTEAAVIMSALNTSQADAFIAAWDAKYAYWSVRPVSVIRAEIDPNWSPYVQTPFFPGYVSGHSTISAAAAEVLAHFFPKDAGWLRDFAKTAADSRLYGGIHVRSDNEVGAQVGRDVAGATLRRLQNVRFAYD